MLFIVVMHLAIQALSLAGLQSYCNRHASEKKNISNKRNVVYNPRLQLWAE